VIKSSINFRSRTMRKVILLPQPLHPFRGCLRIEHENKNVSIDTLKLKLKLNELLLKNHNIFLAYIRFYAHCTNLLAGTPHLLCHSCQKNCPAFSHGYSRACHRLQYIVWFWTSTSTSGAYGQYHIKPPVVPCARLLIQVDRTPPAHSIKAL
jgi:hypothetical protein